MKFGEDEELSMVGDNYLLLPNNHHLYFVLSARSVIISLVYQSLYLVPSMM